MNDELLTGAKDSDFNANLQFPDEIEHLNFICRIIEDEFKKAAYSVDMLDREYMESKRYMAEYRGELDPNEMFQNELLLNQTDRRGAFAVNLRDKLMKLRDSPYFACIDFREYGTSKTARCYIGRFSFVHENELLIFDWRAPVASMFYDYGMGPAGYDSPSGRIEGELTRKRQLKIAGGTIEYVVESSESLHDEVLERELSRTSDEKMKSIISTIQKEQNRIIRNDKADTLIIQGAAGSGKTSIALHRIAYLLYKFKNKLKSDNVAILSPNRVFGDYISGVIPELGEEPVYELSFADIADVQLANVMKYQEDADPLEMMDDRWKQRVRFKSTYAFVELMDEYIQSMQNKVFQARDYVWGRFAASGQWMQERFSAYKSYPVKQRLAMIADDIYDRFQADNIMGEDIPKAKTILKELNSMLAVKSTLSLYKSMYVEVEADDMFCMPAGKTLEWADVYPYIYLRAAFEGIKESKVVKHLVIDEMQDYTPIQYAVINCIFKCSKTILGDFGQCLNPYHSHELADLRLMYEGADFVELNKSYRSTYEIITFARGICPNVSVEPVMRHGEKPMAIYCRDMQEEVIRIRKAIDCFASGSNSTLGVIMKTDAKAKALYDLLNVEINLISPESSGFKGGISITSVRMSKGLEFDEVIIPDADCCNYETDSDRNLLYIACTRAMHKLTLMYTGKITALIEKIV